MHHVRDKVYIYTIFVLSITRWTTGTPPEQSELYEYYEKELVKVVISYRQFIDPSSFSDLHTDTASDRITQEVLRLLEYNLRFVLKLVSDFYQLKNDDGKSAATDVDSQVEVRRVLTLWQTQLEMDVCQLVPRLLTFFYISTNDQSGYVQLHRLHSLLCLKMPTLEKINDPEYINKWTYQCDAKTVRLLFDAKMESRHFRTTTTTTSKEDHHFNGAAFVRKALELADGVDLKRRVLSSLSQYPAYSWRNVFWVTVVNNYHERSDWNEVGQLNEKNVMLYQELCQLNIMYDKKNSAETQQTDKTSVLYKVNISMARALRTLTNHFGHVVRERFNKQLSGRDDVKDMLSNALREVCDQTPLVLSFLKANSSTIDDPDIPIGLYLTLCGDWDGFLKMQCPITLKQDDEHACVKKAIADRLLVNYYKVTGVFDGYDGDSDNAKMTKKASYLRNRDYAWKYVSKVHNVLRAHYLGLGYEFPGWTASDWLTGKHFLANHRFQNPGGPAFALGEQKIILWQIGDRPGAEVLLSEAHNLLLPWHSNYSTVSAFHAVLFRHAEQMMNEFVHRHASIFSLYLRSFDNTLDFARSLNLMLLHPYFRSFGWYVYCARRLLYYLYMPGPREPRGTWSVDDLISKIENLEQNQHLNVYGYYATINPLPAEKVANLSAWTELQLSSLPESEYSNKFIMLLVNNCMDAVKYVNNFIQIVHFSNITWHNNEPELIPVEYCYQLMNDDFYSLDE